MMTKWLCARLPRQTWPYGTIKQGTVGFVEEYTGGACILVLVETSKGVEAYILMGQPDADVKAGDDVTIRFERGGPHGGQWRIVEENREGADRDLWADVQGAINAAKYHGVITTTERERAAEALVALRAEHVHLLAKIHETESALTFARRANHRETAENLHKENFRLSERLAAVTAENRQLYTEIEWLRSHWCAKHQPIDSGETPLCPVCRALDLERRNHRA